MRFAAGATMAVISGLIIATPGDFGAKASLLVLLWGSFGIGVIFRSEKDDAN